MFTGRTQELLKISIGCRNENSIEGKEMSLRKISRTQSFKKTKSENYRKGIKKLD